MASAADDARQDGKARRPAAGIPIDGVYLEHLRNTREPSLSRARLAELIGLHLLDREKLGAMLEGREPLDARTARVLGRVLGRHRGTWTAGSAENMVDPEALADLLAERNMTEDDLADQMARAWRSRDNVAKWENGERHPKPDALGALCAVLSTPEHEITPAELMTGEAPSAAREAAARHARENYYAGLLKFAADRDAMLPEEDGVLFFSADLRREYDAFLLAGSQLAS